MEIHPSRDRLSSTLLLVHKNVPFDKIRSTNKFHKSQIWKKFPNHLSEQEVFYYAIFSSETPTELFELWLDPQRLSERLEKECLGGNDKATEYSIYGGMAYGVLMKVEPSDLSTCRTFVRRDWVGHDEKKHKSQVTMEFLQFGTGTLLKINHKGVPMALINTNDQFWREICLKMKGTPVDCYAETFLSPLKKSQLLDIIFDAEKIGSITKADICKCLDKTENSISLLWKDPNWPQGAVSEVKFEVTEDGRKSQIKFEQKGIALGKLQESRQIWGAFFLNFLKKQLA